MPGTILQTGLKTLADENSPALKQFDIDRLGSHGIDMASFSRNYKEAKGLISKGIVFENIRPEDLIAKISTQAHWARVDFKRGYTNLKNAAKNKDWEAYEKYKAQLKSSFASLDYMIRQLDDKA